MRDDPDDPLGHYMLGLEYARLRRPEDAANAFRRAADLNPDHTAAWRELGKALRDAGRPEEAVAAFETGLEVAARTGDLQTAKEIGVFLRRVRGP